MGKKGWIAAGIALAGVAAGAAYAQYRDIEQPAYQSLTREGAFELREYAPMIVAEVTHTGDRRRALTAGFRRLAAYIFAEDRPGAQIAMTSPVLQDQAAEIAMTAPVLQAGTGKDVWRTRFVMPRQYTMATLPAAPDTIELQEVPGRTVAAITFSGRGRSEDLMRQEARLRSWIAEKGLTITGEAEYAFYDAPMVPAPLRRNEVMIAVSQGD